jgi:hypothetical protein
MKQLIAFCGRKGSGKDTAGIILADYGFKLLKFADPLKAMVRAALRTIGIPEDLIERYVEGDLKEVPLEVWEGRSTRYAMQTLGTEWGRGCIGDCLWVNMFKYRAMNCDLVYCTDVRFPNEVAAIQSLGGKTYRIARPGLDTSDQHASEAGIDLLDVDGVIHNDGFVAELHASVRKIVRCL